ncbi:MAG: hypothetical protein ACOYN0_03960 [Phycisphaerales bacterium]
MPVIVASSFTFAPALIPPGSPARAALVLAALSVLSACAGQAVPQRAEPGPHAATISTQRPDDPASGPAAGVTTSEFSLVVSPSVRAGASLAMSITHGAVMADQISSKGVFIVSVKVGGRRVNFDVLNRSAKTGASVPASGVWEDGVVSPHRGFFATGSGPVVAAGIEIPDDLIPGVHEVEVVIGVVDHSKDGRSRIKMFSAGTSVGKGSSEELGPARPELCRLVGSVHVQGAA